MPTLSTSHVFISYSRRDTEAMLRIVAFLRSQGIKAWVDNERLVPGTPIWEEEIEKAIRGAFAIVVVLSPDAKSSEWVRREITLADQFRKRVFPVLVAGNDEDSIPLRLITRQFVDLRKNESTNLSSLSVAITTYREALEIQEKTASEEAEKLARVEEERQAAENAEQAREAARREAKRIADEKAEAKRAAAQREREANVRRAAGSRLPERTLEQTAQPVPASVIGGKFQIPGQQQPLVRWVVIGIIGLCMLSTGIWGISYLTGGTPTLPATEAPVDPAGAATEPPSEPEVFLPPFSGKSLSASNCDYGGLINTIEATDRYTVTFNLCRPEAAFLQKLALNNFSIYPEEWLEDTISNGARTSEGFERPIGTGPYMVSEWIRGDRLTFTANPNYWGSPPKAGTLVFRWAGEAQQRLLELQSGTVDGIDSVGTDAYDIVSSDPGLSLNFRPSTNLFFVGINNTFAPFDNQLVRQALAMGIDRRRIVDNYLPSGAEVASHIVPCYIPDGCVGGAWHEFDPESAKAMLAEAGFPNGFSTRLYYRDVVRSYLPNPGVVAQDVQSQLLEYLNIEAEIIALDSGTFLDNLFNGQLDGLFLFGWIIDYPHPTSFMDGLFTGSNPFFGVQPSTLTELIRLAGQAASPSEAKSIYIDLNNAILENVPMIPIAHTSSAVAYRADVSTQPASPIGNETFAEADPGGRDTFVWLQSSEPTSLFCADEYDNNSLTACAQALETLYTFENNSANIRPLLAENCEPNVDGTIWVCTLRQGVVFHDGTAFDANDVVTTFSMGLDASSPLHVGNVNSWDYYDLIWGLMNKPQ